MADASDTRLHAPRAGCVLLAVPPVAVVLTFLAYGYLVWSGVAGRPAEGASVDVSWRGCPEAQAVVAARAERMGLADATFEPTADGFRMTATLPAEPDVAASIPATLSQPGHLTVTSAEDGALLLDDAGIADAGVRMDLLMRPATWVRMTPEARERVREHVKAHPEGKLSVAIDGVEVWQHANAVEPGAGELEIPPSADDDRGRMHLAAGRGIVLGRPLPCPIEVTSVTTVGAE